MFNHIYNMLVLNQANVLRVASTWAKQYSESCGVTYVEALHLARRILVDKCLPLIKRERAIDGVIVGRCPKCNGTNLQTCHYPTLRKRCLDCKHLWDVPTAGR